MSRKHTTDVPRKRGKQVCADIRRRNKQRWWTISALWCWGCVTFTRGNPAKMCGGVVECPQVVAEVERRASHGHAG